MKRLFSALILLVAAGWPAWSCASLTRLTNLFVFGDSLMDGGNSGLLSSAATDGKVVFPPPPYAPGQYTNGPVAVEYLWKLFNPGNTNFKPSLAGGTNYAIGGATTGTESFNAVNPNLVFPALGIDLRPIYNQVGSAWELTQFAARTPATFDPATSLFVVWQFPNDLFYFAATDPHALPGQVPGAPVGQNVIANGIGNILTIIQTLAAAGAQHFLVPNMVDLGATPEFLGDADMTAVTMAFNSNLAPALTLLDDFLTSAEIVQFDTFAALNDIIAHPGAYQISNTTQACFQDITTVCGQPDEWLFWDGVHPTTKVHRILAEQLAAAVPEPTSLLLLVLGLLGVAGVHRTKGLSAQWRQAR